MIFAQGHALVIGVGNYAYLPEWYVPATANDAHAVAAVLGNGDYCGYPPEQVVLLNDEVATRVRVLAALDALATRVGQNDTVFLLYSGHGHFDPQGIYTLSTHDTRADANGNVLGSSGVAQHELLERLAAIRAARVLVLCNACHAGALSPTLSAHSPRGLGETLPSDTAAALLSTGTGRIVITACREKQYAFIGAGSLTLFGSALVDGLRGCGGAGQSGFLSAYDLYIYLYHAIAQAVRALPAELLAAYGGIQEPELTVLQGVGPFPVALYQGAEAAEQPALPALRQVDRRDSSRLLRQQLSIGGDQLNLSGDLRGATITINSAGAGRHQPRAAPRYDEHERAVLLDLLGQLRAALPVDEPTSAAAVAAVAALAQRLEDHMQRPAPNLRVLRDAAATLRQTSYALLNAAPQVPSIAAQIAERAERLS